MLGVKMQGLYLYVWFLVKLLHNCYHLWRLLLILFLALLLVSVLVSCRHDVIHSKGGSSQDIFKNFLNLRLQNTNLEVDLQHIHFHLRIPNATVRRKYHVSPIIECFFSFCAKFVEIESGKHSGAKSRIPIFSWGKRVWGSRLVIGGDATDAAESAMWRCGGWKKRERD